MRICKSMPFGQNPGMIATLIALTQARLGPWGEFEGGGAPPDTLDKLSRYGILDPNSVEVERAPLFDRMIYDDAGTTQIRFFQQPLGQGNSSATNGTGLPKSTDDTNMVSTGQLPAPQMFLASSIEVMVEPGSISTTNAWSPQDIAYLTNASAAALPVQLAAQNDIARLLQSGWLDFFIGSKSYLQNARLDSFPPKSYIAPFAAVAQSVNLGVQGVALTRAVGRPFYLNPPVLLMPNVNFTVNLNWLAAIATPTGQNSRITVRLDGFMYRRAQ